MTKDQMIELMEKINKGRKGNIESRRSALNTLVGAFPVGGKVFSTVALDELHIDDSYQRSLQGHVKTDPYDIFKANVCSGEENEYVQRRLAAYLKGTNPDELLRNKLIA